MKKYILAIVIALTLNSCARRPELPPVIEDFQAGEYLGKWYEIARYDNRFEYNLNNGSALYTKEKDGRIEVFNKAYNTKKDFWKEARGYAIPHKDQNKGALKVTFMWPFFADYRILYIDEHYETAIVGSSTLNYLWILARTPTISDNNKIELLQLIMDMNYDIDKLIYPEQKLNM